MLKVVCSLVLISIAALNFIGCSKNEADGQGPVERGKYLITLGLAAATIATRRR